MLQGKERKGKAAVVERVLPSPLRSGERGDVRAVRPGHVVAGSLVPLRLGQVHHARRDYTLLRAETDFFDYYYADKFPIAALTSAVPDERLPLPACQAGDGVRVDGVVAVEAVAGVAGVPGGGRGGGSAAGGKEGRGGE